LPTSNGTHEDLFPRPKLPTEPFATAAVLTAIASALLPVLGTLVALSLAAKASREIHLAQGARGGSDLVARARTISCVVFAVWVAGLIVVLAVYGSSRTRA
jgi:uncharacterized protein (DUF697 family)